MRLEVTFEIELSDEDRESLIHALGTDENDLAEVVSNHAKSALWEYIECYLGRRVFSRGSDILEYRLALLAQHAMEQKLPDEAAVSRLFKTTQSGSRTLLRNALSKYRFELEQATTRSVKSLLENVTWSGDVYHAQVRAASLVELMNQRLVTDDPTLKQVSKIQSVVGTYSIDEHSYDLLCGAFGAEAVPR